MPATIAEIEMILWVVTRLAATPSLRDPRASGNPGDRGDAEGCGDSWPTPTPGVATILAIPWLVAIPWAAAALWPAAIPLIVAIPWPVSCEDPTS